MHRIIATIFVLTLLVAGYISPVAAAPLPVPALAAKSVTITTAPGTVRRGATAYVAVNAWSKATCSISVYYKSGRSTAQGLYTKTAPTSGKLSWSWKVGTRTTPGSWPVTITCGGVSAKTYVKVP